MIVSVAESDVYCSSYKIHWTNTLLLNFYAIFHCQAEWPERYAVAGATVKSLQQRLEESQCSEKEKEALVARLKSHIRQLEESAQKACREENEKEARMEREYKMLQDVSLAILI